MPQDIKLRDDKNEYGTPVSVHKCLVCGAEFTVCPAVPDGVEHGGCTGPECASYDSSRDVDLLFTNGEVEVKTDADGNRIIDLKDSH